MVFMLTRSILTWFFYAYACDLDGFCPESGNVRFFMLTRILFDDL
jgi:hypothetical protein